MNLYFFIPEDNIAEIKKRKQPFLPGDVSCVMFSSTDSSRFENVLNLWQDKFPNSSFSVAPSLSVYLNEQLL